MVEGQGMTVGDVVGRVRDGRLDDFGKRRWWRCRLRVDGGRGLGCRLRAAEGGRAGGRVAHRNGMARGRGKHELQRVELLIPRTRQGSYFPSFVEPRRRSEQAIAQ